ncbi:peroxidase 7 isoform X3 [Asparagus officinalis]|uniref:peroxidase 7 isoform X3 n=1 Tax=Asparagus officinalis TaxID=4686 RepID=UPI00098E4E78|nr:peroxidase 7 isoform X3 [Asparagus officinalis]
MLFFENDMPVLPPMPPEFGLDMTLKHMMKTGGIKFFRTQSPRHFEGGDWNEGGSCRRVKPLSDYQFIMAMGGVPYHKYQEPGTISDTDEDLTFNHYARTCPNFEAIVHNKVKDWISKDYTLAPSLIRLHFHDCAIRGCDASVLLNHKGSERWAKASETLRGFQVIDDIKAELEKKCPKTVSCADILTAVARDATVKIGGPFWENAYGRKDGLVSLAKEAELVPMGHENVTHLIEFFQSRGLSLLDLVVLSGAHTIGRSQCGIIQERLYNFKGTGKADPSIDSKYLNFLKRKCRRASEYVEFDPTTPTKFDSMYYTNLQKKMGLLSTDQLLYSDSRTKPIVSALAWQPMLFYQQFAVSMVNLANAQVLTGDDEGEIRTNCNFVNH